MADRTLIDFEVLTHVVDRVESEVHFSLPFSLGAWNDAQGARVEESLSQINAQLNQIYQNILDYCANLRASIQKYREVNGE